MTSKDLLFKKQFTALAIKRIKSRKKVNSSALKIQKHWQKHLLKVFHNFNPIFKKIKKHSDFTYNIKKESQAIEIFKLNAKDSPNLILTIFLLNLQKSIPKDGSSPSLKINFNYYKTNEDFKWEAKKNIFIGEICSFILKNNFKILDKIEIQSKQYFETLSPLLDLHSKNYEDYQNSHYTLKNFQLPNFIEHLKLGITLNSNSIYNLNFSFSFPVEDTNYTNIKELKLLENNELQIICLENSNSDVRITHKVKIDKINDFIKFHFLHTGFMGFINTPTLYPKILTYLKSKS